MKIGGVTWLPAAGIEAAARRLQGHLVAAPLIGGLPRLPGLPDVDVRWKPELLQPGGSGWYRGYLHFLQRRLGALPGLVFAGPTRRALAASLAAQQLRVPLVVALSAAPPEDLGVALAAAGAELEVAADPARLAEERRRRLGHGLMPTADDPDVAAGLATIGLELAAGLPRSCRSVFVPADCAAAIAAGLEAAHGPPVHEVADGVVHAALPRWLELHHRLQPDAAGLVVLQAALAAPPGDCVAAVLME